MLDEPLLTGTDDKLGGSTHVQLTHSTRSSHMFGLVTGWIQHWWRVTTAQDFLQSRISRRASWRFIIPALSFVFSTLDTISALSGIGEKWWPLADLPYVIISCIYAWSNIRPDNLYVDVVLGGLLGMVCFVQFQNSHVSTIDVGDSSEAADCSPRATVFFASLIMCGCFMGFHGCVIIWFWALAAVCCFISAGQSSGEDDLQILLNTTVISIGCLGMELAIASLYREWQTQLGCNQRLLDCATDGFGVVDCDSGIVLEASPKMLRTLDCSSNRLVGHPLKALVAAGDYSALTDFFGDAQQGVAPAAVMVTCMSERLQFEVRMVPYQLHGSQIGFCVQRVGEVRTVATVHTAVKASTAEKKHVQDASLSGSRPHAAHSSADHLSCAASAAGKLTPIASSDEEGAAADDVEDIDDSVSQVMPRHCQASSTCGSTAAPPPAAAAAAAAASTASSESTNLQLKESHPATPPEAIPLGTAHLHQTHLAMPHPAPRSLGTLSLSSWSVSCEGSNLDSGSAVASQKPPPAAAATTAVAKKVVETRTFGVQVELKSKPPAPLTASTVPKAEETKARLIRRKKLAKACSAVVEEGKPRLPTFVATPRTTRWNSLCHLARSCNVNGTGCCPKHVAWMGLQGLISEELISPCGSLAFLRDWQCSECFAMNAFDDADMAEEEEEREMLCTICNEFVKPFLPRSMVQAVGNTLPQSGCDETEGSQRCVSPASKSSQESSSSIADVGAAV
mmetsp:Transcript_61549/g.146842  ORF Transcript_61549/g.146842 Transcript_61549/m.146842 type:complete len:736 (-) Transcript_61549:108-2315(-)